MKIPNWKSLAPNQKILLRFLLSMAILVTVYFSWFVHSCWTLPIIGPNYSRFVHYAMITLTEGGVLLLRGFGLEAEVFNWSNIDLYDTPIDIHIRNFCLGIDLMAMFVFLVISFPGKIKSRLWFIPLGIIGIHLINIARVTALCFVTIRSGYDQFIDHHNVFNTIATIFIFLMFVQWVKMNDQAQTIQSKF